MGGKGSGRRKVVKEDSPVKGVSISLPSSIRSERPVKVITLPPATFREAPPLSKNKRTRLKKNPPPLPENSTVKMVLPGELDKAEEVEIEKFKPGPELAKALSSRDELKEEPKEDLKSKVKQLTIAPPPVMSDSEVKTYKEYCLSIIDKAEKSGLMKELMLLLNAFRVMFQKQIYRATEEPITAPRAAPSVPAPSQKGRRYSKISE